MTPAIFRRIWVGVVLGVAGLIVVGSLAPMPLLPNETGSDKLGHFLAYFVLALLSSGIVSPERLPRAMLRCFVLGVVLEAVQGLATEHRLAEWADVVVNAAGVLTAWFIAADDRAGWGPRIAERLLRSDKP